ncbi:tetratricopeptide repeat protein [Ramlibacter sp. PS4R-6]|uniref:tetratricopeptide repeat protein n=1 Tax=Ramlibacter sp. PS4R-6 TaxID=3133438 RepID=UPI0030966BFD
MVLNFRHSQPPRRSLPPEPDPADVAALGRQAAIYAGAGRTSEAMRCYQLALLTDEERPDLWFNYGCLQRRIGQVADAIESFEFALRLDPALYQARCQLALARRDMGQPLEALKQFRAVTHERPNYLPAWQHVVQLMWAVGNHDEAVKLAREGLQHAPGNLELQELIARILQDRSELSTEF